MGGSYEYSTSVYDTIYCPQGIMSPSRQQAMTSTGNINNMFYSSCKQCQHEDLCKHDAYQSDLCRLLTTE